MKVISDEGRTAIVYQWEPGFVCKIPWPHAPKHLEVEFEEAVLNEQKILTKISRHPGIVEYHGPCKVGTMKDGLLLREANRGNLQSYIDKEGDSIPTAVRQRWILQISRAVSHIHNEGVVHMNLSTKNVLLHHDGHEIHAIVADFGGSRCAELGLPGTLVPDDPYRDPQLTDYNLPKVDIFSLGVIIYIIATGHYPFHGSPAPPEGEAMWSYGAQVQRFYEQGMFPDLDGVLFGNVIAGCCCQRRFEAASEVVVALETVL